MYFPRPKNYRKLYSNYYWLFDKSFKFGTPTAWLDSMIEITESINQMMLDFPQLSIKILRAEEKNGELDFEVKTTAPGINPEFFNKMIYSDVERVNKEIRHIKSTKS